MSKKEMTIKNYMDSLKISREEAEQLFEDDANDCITDEGEEIEKKAKAMPRKNERKKETKPRKKREVKKDPEKIRIISILYNALLENGFPASVTNAQREIDFDDYTLTLIKHRKPKS